MTTTQLVILWYGGLAVVGLLAVAALDKASLWYGVTAIATLTMLGVVTAAPWNRARRAWVALWVAAPIVLVSAGLAGWQYYSERRATSLIQRSEVDVTDVFFGKRDNLLGSGAYFDARVKNRSKHTLARLEIEFAVAEPSGDVILTESRRLRCLRCGHTPLFRRVLRRDHWLSGSDCLSTQLAFLEAHRELRCRNRPIGRAETCLELGLLERIPLCSLTRSLPSLTVAPMCTLLEVLLVALGAVTAFWWLVP